LEFAATAKILLSQRGVKTSHSNNLQRRNDSQGSKCGQSRRSLQLRNFFHFEEPSVSMVVKQTFAKNDWLLNMRSL